MAINKTPKRARQVADVIRSQLAFILKKDVRDPRLSNISITSVNVSPDLANARIYFTLPDAKDLREVEKGFAKCTGYLRHQLAGSIEMRYVPELHFVYDKTLEHGARISTLIDEAILKDQQNKPTDDND